LKALPLDWLSPAVRQQWERNPSRRNVAPPLGNSTRLAPPTTTSISGKASNSKIAASRMSTIVSARSSENPRSTNLSIWPARFIYKKEYICSFLLSNCYYSYKKEHMYTPSLPHWNVENQTIPHREAKGPAKSRTTKSLGRHRESVRKSPGPMELEAATIASRSTLPEFVIELQQLLFS